MLLLAVVIAAGGLSLAPHAGGAQRAQSPLEIGGMSHTVVDGRSVVVVAVENNGPRPVQASGEFELVDAQGDAVSQVAVSTGTIDAGANGVIAVPLATLLPAGRYTATLSLEGRDATVRANSGLREISVGQGAPEPTAEPVATTTPVEVGAPAERGGGFPSWPLLVLGLAMTVAGIGYLRATTTRHEPAPVRPVPEVSMVRKVKISSPPTKRPATIKPLVPPRRHDD